MSLGLKCLVTDVVALAAANETAASLRAIKLVTAFITANLKNDQFLGWDQTLLLNTIETILQQQVDALTARKKEKLANKTADDREESVCSLVEDQFLTT